MNLVTFCEIDESLIDSKHTIEHFNSGSSGDADVALIDINTIFDYEENKAAACKEKYVSLAIIDEESDYDAFKNFGIDAWIKREDLSDINGILNLIEKRS
ncbi:hypothetical protein A9Q76_05370 [Arcobacter sp. 31_11_sub10_T18]|nr:hypothetical protein A9Q76_05370 [Arcobacter sp. 31_11_sub10_T18]